MHRQQQQLLTNWSDQVVSDSEMAEEIAKMYEVDESPLHVKEKEVEPVKKEELSLEVEPTLS